MSFFSPTSEMRSNFRHLYADVFWYGILAGSTIAFISIYLTRLGATSFQISLLAAGPAVVSLLFSLPAGNWLAGRSLIKVTFWAAILQRVGYLVLIPLPWLLGDKIQVWAVIGFILLMSVPATVLAISFNAMFADVVPAEARGEVVGKRNALLAISMTGANILCGQLLDRIAFPTNYQIVFGLGVIGAALSTYYLGRLRLSGAGISWWEEGRPVRMIARLKLSHFLGSFKGKPLLRVELLRGPFGLFMAAYLMFYSAQYLPLTLFPLTVVNQLHLTDGQISLGNSMFYIIVFLVSLRLSYISQRYGHRRLFAASALGFGLYPLLLGLAKDVTLYWVTSILGGVVWAVLGASSVNRLMERIPADDRPAYMALHNLVLNLGILTGSLLAPVLSELVGIQDALLMGAGLRTLAGLLLVIWG